MSSLNLGSINDEAKGLSLEEFTAKFEQPFLLHEESQSTIDVDSTQTMGLCYMPTQVAAEEAGNRTVYAVKPGTVTLGRREDNDIVVDDPSVSKLHARLTVNADGSALELVDAGSRNGTYCDGHQAEADASVEVKSGTIVTFGRVPLRFINPEELFMYLRGLRAKGEL